jgi:hypothetical protein
VGFPSLGIVLSDAQYLAEGTCTEDASRVLVDDVRGLDVAGIEPVGHAVGERI